MDLSHGLADGASLPDGGNSGPSTVAPSPGHAKQVTRASPIPFSEAPMAPVAMSSPATTVAPAALNGGVGGGTRERGEPAGLLDTAQAFLQRLRETSPLTLLWVGFLVGLLMTGNAMILICVNFWLEQFPNSGRYTVFAFSGFVFAVFFLVALGLYILLRRPDLSFLRHALSWKLLWWIGIMDTLNSGLAVYAAPKTPEVLQALFSSLVPVYAAVFTKVALKDPRQYCNRYILVSFSLIILGVTVASFFYLSGGSDTSGEEQHHRPTSKARDFLRLLAFIPREGPASCTASQRGAVRSGNSRSSFFALTVAASSASSASASPNEAPPRGVYDTILWSAIYFISVIPTVLMNGGQTLFMVRYTYEDSFVADAQQVLARESTPNGADGDEEVSNTSSPGSPTTTTAAGSALATGDPGLFHPFHADDTTVKLVMLAGGTTIQSLLTVLFFPVDALPWFGSSSSIADSWANFTLGVDCIFHCPNNFLFCVLYCVGFLLVYVSAAYLNQYSVTLCSMVTQLAAPCTAIAIVLFPVLNPSHDTTPWFVSTLSACILGVGTFVYVVWDEQTAAEKRLGEVRLKMGMLGLLNSSRTPTSRDTTRTDTHGHPVEYVLVQSHEDDV